MIHITTEFVVHHDANAIKFIGTCMCMYVYIYIYIYIYILYPHIIRVMDAMDCGNSE